MAATAGDYQKCNEFVQQSVVTAMGSADYQEDHFKVDKCFVGDLGESSSETGNAFDEFAQQFFVVAIGSADSNDGSYNVGSGYVHALDLTSPLASGAVRPTSTKSHGTTPIMLSQTCRFLLAPLRV
ncbi:unnamed protein product [Prorocentrum cordatum]|uniref:Subtilisin n=1 Tax=Prorocentrum cordatum TaxID=2364126 RepID=A0ABN9W2I5_9DINO|nr:unnamed protein product [Polarella glacialis]